MIILLQPQGFTKITQISIIKLFRISSTVSTGVRSVNPGVKETNGSGATSKFNSVCTVDISDAQLRFYFPALLGN